MTTPTYARAERLWLKRQTEFNEAWVQDRIAEDPSILGLGDDLVLLDRERRQQSGGRLDLLLLDTEEDRRFEVELMLGATDESHVVRTIEYWDIERRRYPAYDHCAVLVAEEVTSRFLNVLGLLVGTIPLIVIQLNALLVNGSIVLDFVRVLDRAPMRDDDETEAKLESVDRDYWLRRSSPAALALLDDVVASVRELHGERYRANYNRGYVGLHDGVQSRNFVVLGPRKRHLHLDVAVPDPHVFVERLEEAGLTATTHRRRLRVSVSPEDWSTHKPLLTELLKAAEAPRE
jgi:hypothetical protein